MRILLRRYPRRSALVFVCLLIAGIFEGVGLLALLPVLKIASGEKSDDDEGMVHDLFGMVGLEPTIGALLIAVRR